MSTVEEDDDALELIEALGRVEALDPGTGIAQAAAAAARRPAGGFSDSR